MKPNNVTRLLDSRSVPYTAYQLPAEKLGALETAHLLNVPAESVYKTIVITRQGKGKPILALVPGTSEVDLKLLAKAIDEKKLVLPTEKDAERITGLQAGGISPLALLNHGFEVILDESARNYEEIHISGGQRGLNIQLPVLALIDIVKAKVLKIAT
jgi:Cys-tRNA(Pro)/Cys-tRNA(Cys) deacylase